MKPQRHRAAVQRSESRGQRSDVGVRGLAGGLVLCVAAGLLWFSSVRGGSVSGYLVGSDGRPLTNSVITFTPKQTPMLSGAAAVMTKNATQRVTNGAFTVPLMGGNYRVNIDGADPFYISMPDGTNGWALSSLISTGLNSVVTAPPTITPWTATIARTNVWGAAQVVTPGENDRGTLENDGLGNLVWTRAGYVNARLWATGGGDIDDTVALNTAVANLPLSPFGRRSGKLMLPSGHYKVSGPIRVPTGTIIEGEGVDATTIETTSTTEDVFQLIPVYPQDSTITTLVIRDLMIIKPTNSTAGYCINLDTSPTNYSCYFEFNNLYLYGGYDGIHTKGIVFGKADKVVMEWAARFGWFAETPVNAIIWNSCSARYCGLDGMFIQSANYCSITSGAYERNGRHGILFGDNSTWINTVSMNGVGFEDNVENSVRAENVTQFTGTSLYSQHTTNAYEFHGGQQITLINPESLLHSGYGVYLTTNHLGVKPIGFWMQGERIAGGLGEIYGDAFFRTYGGTKFEITGIPQSGGTPFDGLSLFRHQNAQDTRVRMTFYDEEHQLAAAIGSVREGGATSWGLSFETGSGDSSGGPSEKMRLTSDGLLGIGKLPEVALDVAGATRISGAVEADSFHATNGISSSAFETTPGGNVRVFSMLYTSQATITNGFTSGGGIEHTGYLRVRDGDAIVTNGTVRIAGDGVAAAADYEALVLEHKSNSGDSHTRIGFKDMNQRTAAIEAVREGSGTDWGLAFQTGSGDSSDGPTNRVTISSTGTLGVLGGVTDFGGVTYTWPTNQGSAATYLKNDGSGLLSWASVSGGTGTGAVSSVYGRAGDVVAAGGDYAASLVTNDSGVTGFSVASALNTLNGTKAATNHTHAGTDITNAVAEASHATNADHAVAATVATNALGGWPVQWPEASITNASFQPGSAALTNLAADPTIYQRTNTTLTALHGAVTVGAVTNLTMVGDLAVSNKVLLGALPAMIQGATMAFASNGVPYYASPRTEARFMSEMLLTPVSEGWVSKYDTWSAIASDTNAFGVQRLITTAVAANYAGVVGVSLSFGGPTIYCRVRFRIPNSIGLNNGTDDNYASWGFADDVTVTNCTDGLFVAWGPYGSSNNVFHATSYSNGSRGTTYFSTATPAGGNPTTDQWYVSELITDGTTAYFRIDNEAWIQIANTLPTASARATNMEIRNYRYRGSTTARAVEFDYYYVHFSPNYSR